MKKSVAKKPTVKAPKQSAKKPAVTKATLDAHAKKVNFDPMETRQPRVPDAPNGLVAKEAVRAGFVLVDSAVNDRRTVHTFDRPDGAALTFSHDNIGEGITAHWTAAFNGRTVEGTSSVELAVALYSQDLPVNVVSAVRLLHKETKGTCKPDASDAGYAVRLRVLKALRGTDKVRVKEAEAGPLARELAKLLDVKSATVGTDFRDRCAEIAKAEDSKDRKVARAAKESETAIKRTAKILLYDAKQVVELPKPLSKKARAVKETEEKAAIIEEARRAREDGPEWTIDRTASVAWDPRISMAFEYSNGCRCLRLEEPTVHGALMICDNGKRVGVGVWTLTSRPKLMSPQPNLAEFARELLGRKEVQPAAAAHLRAFLAACELNALRVEEAREIAIRTPAEFAGGVATVPGDVVLMEGLRGAEVMLLERPNSQGALSVYNNGRRVSLVVVPPEILRILRPVPVVDLADSVQQLLSPPSGIAVSPAATSRLTALLERIKEIHDMATKKKAKYAAPKSAPVKVASKKSTGTRKPAGERKSSLFRLKNDAKTTWSAFGSQKKEIVDALVKLGAVGAKATGVTSAALRAAVPGIKDKNVAFYLSVWNKDGLLEKLPAA